MKVKVPSHHILVRLEKLEKPREEVSSGGIVLDFHSSKELEREQKEISIGTVMYIGPTAFHTRYSKEPWCKVGDVVQFHKYTGELVAGSTGEHIYRSIVDLDLKVVRTDDEDGVEI